MNLNLIQIDPYATLGNVALLTNISPAFAYTDGKRTNNVVGYRYEVVLPERVFEKLSVRVDGEKRLELPENETPQVVFEGLKMSLYWTPQGHNVKTTAENIKFLNPPKKS